MAISVYSKVSTEKRNAAQRNGTLASSYLLLFGESLFPQRAQKANQIGLTFRAVAATERAALKVCSKPFGTADTNASLREDGADVLELDRFRSGPVCPHNLGSVHGPGHLLGPGRMRRYCRRRLPRTEDGEQKTEKSGRTEKTRR